MHPKHFQEHDIFKQINDLLNLLNEQKAKDILNVEEIDFIQATCHYAQDRLKVAIPVLVNEEDLSIATRNFGDVLRNITNPTDNQSYYNRTSVDELITEALNHIANIPIPTFKSDFNYSLGIAQFQNTVLEKLNQTEKRKDEVKKQFEFLSGDMKNAKSVLNELQEKIEKKQKKIDELGSNIQEQFNDSRNTFSKQVHDDRNLFREEMDEDREKIKADTANLIKELNSKLEDAKKIVNVIGNVGVTGNYQIIANQHKKTADNWRITAIGFMLALSFLLIFSIWKIGDVDYDWHKAIIRIVASAILIYPATYAARESSKHRKLENSNKRMELELASINPFIELLSQSKQQEIKEKLVERYFGNDSSKENESEGIETVSAKMLEQIAKIFGSISKK
jgi:hypothetical protein